MKRSRSLLISVCSLCLFAGCGGGSGGFGNNLGGGGSGNGGGNGGGNAGGGAPSGSFALAGRMAFARQGHTAVLLTDGNVLIAGGSNASGDLATAEIFETATGSFAGTGNMNTSRAGHTATLLNGGKVLVAGGGTDSAEIFDPTSGTFTLTGSMQNVRTGHTATLLNDGRVLVAGGGSATAEVFDPKTGLFTAAGNMIASRIYQMATLLANGEVLVAGGTDSGGTALGELFDPSTSSFSPTATGGTQALHLAATSLQDGRVFLAGGQLTTIISGGTTRCCVSGPVSVSLANLFDIGSDSFSAVGDMSASRSSLTETLLPDGDVLIVGGATISTTAVGTSAVTSVQPQASAELFHPSSSTFAPTGNLNIARAGQTATLLGNGQVLVTGGADANGNPLASAEIYH